MPISESAAYFFVMVLKFISTPISKIEIFKIKIFGTKIMSFSKTDFQKSTNTYTSYNNTSFDQENYLQVEIIVSIGLEQVTKFILRLPTCQKSTLFSKIKNLEKYRIERVKIPKFSKV